MRPFVFLKRVGAIAALAVLSGCAGMTGEEAVFFSCVLILVYSLVTPGGGKR